MATAKAATTSRAAPAARPASAPQPNYQPLVVVLVALCAGILADRFFPAVPQAWWWLCGLALLLWLTAWTLGQDAAAALMLLLALAALGGAWHHHSWRLYPADELSARLGEEGQPVAVVVRAKSGPRRLAAPPFDPFRIMQPGKRTRLEIAVLAVRDGQEWTAASGAASLIIDGHAFDCGAGDELLVIGQAGRILPPLNPGEVDFAAHARGDRRLFWLRAEAPAAVRVLRRGKWSVSAALDAARRHGNQALWRLLHNDRSGFAAALLLGDRGQLEEGRTEVFFHTNTIHFLAISGLHVMILAGALFLGLRAGFLPRNWTLACVALTTVAYTLLTDAPPSAVRSMVLVLLLCLSMALGRPALAFNCLGASGIVLLAINPCELFRAGAQLSFLAVGTLAWFGPRWVKWQERDALARLIERTRPWPVRAARWLGRWTLRGVYVTATVWAVTLPLVAWQFHLVSPVAILISPLVGPPMAAALLSGFGIMLFAWVWPPLAVPLALVCDHSLWLIDVLVIGASRVPGAYFWVSGPRTWWVAVFYAGLFSWAALVAWRPRMPWSIGALGAWVVLGYALAGGPQRSQGRLECTFLSVGHGCCAVLHLPDGRTLMYDAGKLNAPQAAARSAAAYLWQRGVSRIDHLVISHADLDHYNAVPRLLTQFDVGEIAISPVMFRQPDLPLSILRQRMEQSGVPVIEWWDGQRMPFAGGRIAVLHPPRGGTGGSDNANSLVLLVEFQGRRILLTGDLEPPGLTDLLLQERLDCDVVLAPHHGSLRSDPPGLAAWSRPEWVVISGGNADQSRAVAAAYQQLGATVLHTDRHGAVTFVVEHGQVDVSWHRPEEPWKP